MKIGAAIYTLRTSKNISQGKLCYGLCSVSTLSRIENGKDNISRLLFESLLQRLGKSPDKYEYLAGKNEKLILDMRKQILDAYAEENVLLAFDKLKNLSCTLNKNDTINKQFISKMKTLLSYSQEDSCTNLSKNMIIQEKTVIGLLQTLQITVPKIMIGQLISHYLSIEELRIYFLIGARYLDLYDTDTSIRIFIEIIDYFEEKYYDKEEWLKLYPQTVYQLGLQYEAAGEYEKLYSICTKGINLLVENTCIYYLPELLHMKTAAIKGLNNAVGYSYKGIKDNEYSKLISQAQCLDELIHEFFLHDDVENIHLISSYKQDNIKFIYLVNEIIKRQRKLQKKTQEDLSTKFYTSEHMSRIEIGRKTPNTKNYHMIMDELGLSKERYQSSIITEDFEILVKDRNLSSHIEKFQFEEAEKLFLEISDSISCEIPKNKQFLIMTKAIIEHGLNHISIQEKLEQCEQALRCTIPTYERDNLNFVNVIFSHNEITLVSNIASAYKNLGDLQYATRLLREMLNAYKKLEAGIQYHMGSYTFLLTHYASNLGLSKHYIEAIDTHREVLRLGILYGHGDNICASLYGIAWNLLELDKGNKEACKKLYRQAYCICEIMQMNFYRNWYRDKYLKVFGESIIY